MKNKFLNFIRRVGIYNILIVEVMVLPIILGLTILIIFLGDYLNVSERLNLHLRYDWASILCTFFAALASFALIAITIIQIIDSKKSDQQLLELNLEGLKTSKISNGYSLINFRVNQLIYNNGKTLKIKIFDTKSIPLNKISIKSISIKELASNYMESNKPAYSILDRKQKLKLEYTPAKDKKSLDYYYANIAISLDIEKITEDHIRLDFDFDIINTLGVKTSYEYHVMVAKKDSTEQKDLVLKKYHEYCYINKIEAIKR